MFLEERIMKQRMLTSSRPTAFKYAGRSTCKIGLVSGEVGELHE